MLRQDDPDLDILTKRLKSADTPDDKRIKICSDLGYKKIDDIYPGGIHKQPHKKHKQGELTKKQKQDNKSIGKRRVRVEHAIGKLKRYAIFGKKFDGTVEKFNLIFSVITGFANLKTLWDHKRKKPKRVFC